MLALDRPIAPGFDGCVDLLVQVRHGRGRHPRAPQRLQKWTSLTNYGAGSVLVAQALEHREPVLVAADGVAVDQAGARPQLACGSRMSGKRADQLSPLRVSRWTRAWSRRTISR